jgi:hypothetical protein
MALTEQPQLSFSVTHFDTKYLRQNYSTPNNLFHFCITVTLGELTSLTRCEAKYDKQTALMFWRVLTSFLSELQPRSTANKIKCT